MTPVNESLGSSDSARTLRQALGDALFSAADRLAETGGVLEVRVLQGGQIVTGIVGGDGAAAVGARIGEAAPTTGAAVSVQGTSGPSLSHAASAGRSAESIGTQNGMQPNAGAPNGAKANAKYRVYIRGAQRECSCGARGNCVHAAAVLIVAARTGGASQARPAGGTPPAPVSAARLAGSSMAVSGSATAVSESAAAAAG